MKTKTSFIGMIMLLVTGIGFWFFPSFACAHCDTLEGPVVKDAKIALEKKDITPVLKWVKKDHEEEIKEAFKKTLRVRAQSKEAKDLADMYFFETLIRIHRAGEGAPYTGLKTEKPEPIILEADKALENDSVDNLIKYLTNAVANGIKERFIHAKEAKKYIEEGVEPARQFVEAYVEFTHYVERLYMDATKFDHGKPQEAGLEEHHH